MYRLLKFQPPEKVLLFHLEHLPIIPLRYSYGKEIIKPKARSGVSTAAPDFGTLISSVIATLHLATVELLLLNIFPIASEFFFFKGRPTSAGAAELHPAALIHCCAVYPGHNLTPIQHPAHFPAPLLALPPSPGVRTFDVLRLSYNANNNDTTTTANIINNVPTTIARRRVDKKKHKNKQTKKGREVKNSRSQNCLRSRRTTNQNKLRTLTAATATATATVTVTKRQQQLQQ
ncbi:unnamed protein product [Ceratitis capitata]|uniref:(Mediterranean fruit fly) hypothetical protein n=1 Tax=Ceratitis capitata TaxID=7213 RepID=A0A811VHE7_CERCA|nr:unnamed protein product [Ceratitis capitata]